MDLEDRCSCLGADRGIIKRREGILTEGRNVLEYSVNPFFSHVSHLLSTASGAVQQIQAYFQDNFCLSKRI
jgi:hypothetical protein